MKKIYQSKETKSEGLGMCRVRKIYNRDQGRETKKGTKKCSISMKTK